MILFIFYIVLWYLFTSLSTIYSKKYLNQTNDPFTLTLVIFLVGLFFLILKLIYKRKNSNINNWFALIISSKNLRFYSYLALYNVATIFLTNIGIFKTSIAFTYMIKVKKIFNNNKLLLKSKKKIFESM